MHCLLSHQEATFQGSLGSAEEHSGIRIVSVCAAKPLVTTALGQNSAVLIM